MLEDAMVVAPRHEASLFGNRDKFDLVAVYDGSSESFGAANTPLSILVRVISEQAFQLKRMPMMLVGGFEAWKREIGNTELHSASSVPKAPNPKKKHGVSRRASLVPSRAQCSPYRLSEQGGV